LRQGEGREREAVLKGKKKRTFFLLYLGTVAEGKWERRSFARRKERKGRRAAALLRLLRKGKEKGKRGGVFPRSGCRRGNGIKEKGSNLSALLAFSVGRKKREGGGEWRDSDHKFDGSRGGKTGKVDFFFPTEPKKVQGRALSCC